MSLQRYDVPAPGRRSGFVERVWDPVNAPVVDGDGAVAGVLHHVEDMTDAYRTVSDASAALSGSPAGEPGATSGDDADPRWYRLARTLQHENRSLRRLFDRHADIEQAKGILMASRRCAPDEAFAILRGISQDMNVKVHLVARALIEEALAREHGESSPK